MRRKAKWQPKLIAAVLAVGLAASPVQSSLSQAYADSKAAEAVPEETEEEPEKESSSKTEETGKDDTNKVESGEGKLDEENKDTGSNIEDKFETEGKKETDITEEAEKDKEESCFDASSENQDKTEGSREESSTEEETKEGSGSGETEESGKDTGETDETEGSTEESSESESKADTEESTEAGSEEGKDETADTEETVESSEEENEAETKAEETEEETEETKETEEQKEAEAIELSTTVSGVKVTVHADAGVFLEDVKLEAVKITDEEILKNLTEAAGLADGDTAYETMALDVKLLDQEGKEVQPDTEAGELTVTFEKVAKALDTKAEEVTVYHFEDEEGTGAEEKEVKAEEDALTVEAGHFSPFLFAVKTEQEKAELFSGGAGTQDDPYIIASVDDLKKLAEAVNAGNSFSGQYLKIADDIKDGVLDISSEAWISIGKDAKNPFRGNFDGNGKTIRGLNDESGSAKEAVGLFGFISDATIHDLILEEVNFTRTVFQELDRAALAVRVLGNSTIKNIKASGNIAAATNNGKIGGIIACAILDSNTIIVSDCVNEVNLEPTNRKKYAVYAGGIIGSIESGASGASGTVEIINCENRANISGKRAGGILGYSAAGKNKISQSANTGMITGDFNAAGIVGESVSGGDAISNCYNRGSITATGNGTTAAGIYTGTSSGKKAIACLNVGEIGISDGTSTNVYQIGPNPYEYTENSISSYYIADKKIFISSSDGRGEGTEQNISTEQLAELLNEAGKTDNFWKIQDGTILPEILVEEEEPEEPEKPEECIHEGGGYLSDEQEHWQICNICKKPIDKGAHSFTKDGKTCEICGYEKKEADKGNESDKLSNTGSSGSRGSGSFTTIRNNGNWHQDNVGWWFAKTGGGYPAGQWYECYWNGEMHWYHFNAQGYLDAGWFIDKDGATYYLHNQHDNHFGYMYTGWNWIDGKCYYFAPNAIAGGPKQGMLYKNGITPDGYSVNETGAWTVNGAIQTK